MNVEKVDSAQTFRGLNIKKVAHQHRHFVRENIGELKKLAEQYDINMKSIIDSDFQANGIEITVKNLRKNLGFLQRFYRTKGKSFFYTDARLSAYAKDTTVLGQTQEAIAELRKNSLLKRMG